MGSMNAHARDKAADGPDAWRRRPYSFESPGSAHSVRKGEDAWEDLLVFAGRLRIDELALEQHADELSRYVVDVHLNIAWYVRRLRREKLLWALASGLNLALLFALPLLILLLSKMAGRWGDATMTSAQLTAVLTGLFAVHKSVGAWLDRRKRIGHFWKAGAELKELLYSFEEQWKGKAAQGGELTAELLEALDEDVARARALVRKERDAFYELYHLPSMDILTRLQESFKATRTLLDQHRVPGSHERQARAVEREAAREAALRRQRRHDAELAGLERRVAELRADLREASEAERARTESAIADLRDDIEKVQRKRIEVEAELASLM